MKNIIEFKTGERPIHAGKGMFPYNKLLSSLIALRDTTKCIILGMDEITQNNLTFLRRLTKDKKLGFVRACKLDGKMHLWLVGDERCDG